MDDDDVAKMMAALKEADIGYFELALAMAIEHPNGFTRDALMTVEAAWRNANSAVATLGWIVDLKDRRRLYLVLVAVGIEDEEDELTITVLEVGQPYPGLEGHPGAYWYRPDFLNEHLGVSSRTLN